MTRNTHTRHRFVGRQLGRRLPLDVGAAVAITCLSALTGMAEEPDGPAGDIAAQIRAQGYACRQPVAATREPHASAPDSAVWLLRCGNARYRVRLVPDMAAEVTQLK